MHCSAARFVSTDRHCHHLQVLAWCALLLTLAEPSFGVDRVAPDRVAPDRVLPDRVLPDRVLPDRVLPDRVLPDRVPPDRVPTPAHGQAPSAAATPAEPTAFSGLPKAVGRKLRLSYQVAVQRLHTVETCRGLFADLGTDGFEILGRTVYAWPEAVEREVCMPGISAFTRLGSALTWLCDDFGYLHRNEAVMVLIHEGLHRAGLAERPLTDAVLSSQDINRMVVRACRL